MVKKTLYLIKTKDYFLLNIINNKMLAVFTNNKTIVLTMLEKSLTNCPQEKKKSIENYMEFVRDKQEVSKDELEFFKNYTADKKLCPA